MRAGIMRVWAAGLVVGFVACSSSACSSSSEEEESGEPAAPAPSPSETPVTPCKTSPCEATVVVGDTCQVDAECVSDFCEGALCGAPGATAHSDGRRNAGETDIDCGGPAGKTCPEGAKCKVAADCETICTAGVCAPPSDTDGKKNNGETDVDCGGPTAKKCAVAKACETAADCGLGYCLTGACAAPSPTDAVQNGTETDIDCGGAAQTFDGVSVAAAKTCDLAQKCTADADCGSQLCAESKRCVEAASCRPVHGGYTCGKGEFGAASAVHESCCKTLPVPGLTMMQGGVAKQVYVDKYEITAGRVREWVKSIKAQFGGVPNIQSWVKTRMQTDPILAKMYPTDRADYLPMQATGQIKPFPKAGGGTENLDIGLQDQIGPTSYYRGVLGNGGTSGCGQYAGSFGHRTYWFNATEAAYFSEVVRPAEQQEWLDEKAMNCMTAQMFAAFCAWDGGYLQTQTALAGAYGATAWPWGATPLPSDEVAKISNYNSGTGGFGNAKNPRYLYPIVNYATFSSDFSPIIAAPGRFPGDASQVRPATDTWMDLGGNMIEWSHDGNGGYFGWTGASFEGHIYGRAWSTALVFMDKYGKGGTRCMRLK
jgi:hypothetical protein